MKNLKKHIPTLFISLSLLFICTTCKEKEDYYDVTYYKTIGTGYVFMYDSTCNSYPVQGAEIEVSTGLGYTGGFLSPPLPKETFITDETGKYQIRFIKHCTPPPK
jgi:hypothetical protein